jgi:hypothetical protein
MNTHEHNMQKYFKHIDKETPRGRSGDLVELIDSGEVPHDLYAATVILKDRVGPLSWRAEVMESHENVTGEYVIHEKYFKTINFE